MKKLTSLLGLRKSEHYDAALKAAGAEPFWQAADKPLSLQAVGAENLRQARREVLRTGGVVLPSLSMRASEGGAYELPSAKAPTSAPAFSLCANTGHFCSRSGQRCVRWCHCASGGPHKGVLTSGAAAHAQEVRESELAELGANVSAYFKLSKMLTLVYCILAALSVPLVIICLYGGNDSATSANLLATTTLGNVAGVNSTTSLVLPVAGTVPIGRAAVFYAVVDLVMMAVVVAAYFWAKVFVAREVKQVDRLSMSLQDYALYLPNVAPSTTARQVEEWVQRVVAKEVGTATAEHVSGALDLYRVARDINVRQAEGRGGAAASGAVDPSAPGLMSAAFKVHRVDVVPSHQVLEGKLAAVGGLKAAEVSYVGAIKAHFLSSALTEARLAKPAATRLGALGNAATRLQLGLMRALRLAPTREGQLKGLATIKAEIVEVGKDLEALVLKEVKGKEAEAMPSAGAFVCFERA
jgi:hypothetical protein